MSNLSTTEASKLAKCEGVIEAGCKTFVEVGLALAEIRESRLYRAAFDTFEDYCQEKWGWTRRYSDNLIQAANVVKSLPTNENHGSQITSERQARELAKVEPEKRVEVLGKAVASGPVTARTIRQAATTEMEGPKADSCRNLRRLP